MTVADGPGSTAPAARAAAVLLCSDAVPHQPGELSPEMICDALRRHAPDVRVFVVPDLCSRFSELPATVRALRTGRVVVGCRQGHAKRHRITGVLRNSGVNRAGAQVVDLTPDEGARPHDVAEQSIARLRAALARVSHADIGGPVWESEALGPARLSRRNLFSLDYLARRPVAGWTGERCAGRGASRACVQACPHQALTLAGPSISVDTASCTGCGACVAACRSGAMGMNGASMAELEAAASTLVEDARRLSVGVAIVCSAATHDIPLGGPWLALEVPSLEMVSVGWLLQVVAAGASVTTRGCRDEACEGRGRQLALLTSDIVGLVAPRLRSLVIGPDASAPACPGGDGGLAVPAPGCSSAEAEVTPRRGPFRALQFREPEATVHALTELTDQQMPEDNQLPWRLESPLAPLGEIVIDAARCSGCGCCVPACPTGAISARDEPESSGLSREALDLQFAPAACSACGACVPSCPEAAVSLRRAVGSSSLSFSRRTIAEVPGDDRCGSCGKLLGRRDVANVVAAKLASSHPEIANRLRGQDRCPDCLLTV